MLYCICANVTCVAIRLFLHSQLPYHTTWIWIPHGRDSAGRYVVTGSGPIRQHIGPIRLGVLGDFDWRTRLLVFASSSVHHLPSPPFISEDHRPYWTGHRHHVSHRHTVSQTNLFRIGVWCPFRAPWRIFISIRGLEDVSEELVVPTNNEVRVCETCVIPCSASV